MIKIEYSMTAWLKRILQNRSKEIDTAKVPVFQFYVPFESIGGGMLDRFRLRGGFEVDHNLGGKTIAKSYITIDWYLEFVKVKLIVFDDRLSRA